MKDLISAIRNSSESGRSPLLANITEIINRTPQSYQDFKQEFIRQGLVATHIASFIEILKGLDFVPPPSSETIVGTHVYRGSGLPPAVVKKQGGFLCTGKSRSIFEHQKSTGSSIYVGCSKDVTIAVEHAFQHTEKYVYKIGTNNGICVNDFLFPHTGLHMEKEVVFAHRIPISQVLGYAIISDFFETPQEFSPL